MKGGMLAGLLVLGAFGGAVFAWKSGLAHLPKPKKPKVLLLPVGTKVPLVLTTTLTSGGTKTGETVDLLVTDDVKLGPQVVIERGTKVQAEVTKSRGATAASAVANQPARLEITLKSVSTADGHTLKLVGTDGPVYEFTQKNTAGRKDAAKVDRLWETPEGKQALESLRTSSTEGGLHAPDPAALQKVADAVGMEKTKQLLAKPRQDQPADKMLGALAKGDLASVAGFDQVLGIQALGEIASVTRAVDDKLRGIFKGNNIEATVGTPIVAKTGEKYSITLPPKQ